MEAVVINKLTKTYGGENKAVDEISLSLKKGEIFGLLGPNGAGKTTTIKLLNGMLTPSGGSCSVFDMDPVKDSQKLHQMSGVFTEHAQMYDHLSGRENLMFYGALFGMSQSDCEKRAKALLKRLELVDAMERKLATYSTGMRQRLSLARALMHSPQILFLDEPTSGLDPESARNVNMFIQELASEGITIFLCTHQLRYAQETCTSFGLMNEGSLLAAGNMETLRSMVSSKVRVSVKASCMPENMICTKVDEGIYDIHVNSEKEIPMIVKEIVGMGGDLYHIFAEQMSLEEIYFSLINKTQIKKEREDL